MYHNYLIHHGISGQKWGVRRYQNEDGTLTEEGKRRYSNADGSLNEAGKKFEHRQKVKKAMFEPTVKGGKDKPNISPAAKTLKETQNTINETQNIVRTVQRMKKDPNSDKAKEMSDEELRKAINRIRMEREYTSLTQEDTQRGFDAANNILAIAGSIAGIGVSAATIYSLMKNIK